MAQDNASVTHILEKYVVDHLVTWSLTVCFREEYDYATLSKSPLPVSEEELEKWVNNDKLPDKRGEEQTKEWINRGNLRVGGTIWWGQTWGVIFGEIGKQERLSWVLKIVGCLIWGRTELDLLNFSFHNVKIPGKYLVVNNSLIKCSGRLERDPGERGAWPLRPTMERFLDYFHTGALYVSVRARVFLFLRC